MTKTTALALALVFVAGCRKKEEGKAAAPGAGGAPSSAGRVKQAPLTAEQRKQAAAHVRAGRKLDEVCGCLKSAPSDTVFFEDQSGANNLDCDFEKTGDLAGVRLVHFGADDAEKAFFVVADTGKGWAVIGDVDHDQDLGRTQEK